MLNVSLLTLVRERERERERDRARESFNCIPAFICVNFFCVFMHLAHGVFVSRAVIVVFPGQTHFFKLNIIGCALNSFTRIECKENAT